MIAIDWNFRYRDSIHFRLAFIPVPVFRWNVHTLVRGNDARSPRHFLPPVFGRHKWKTFLALRSSILYNTFLGAEKRACRPIFVLNSWRRVASVIPDLDAALVGLHQLVVVIRGVQTAVIRRARVSRILRTTLLDRLISAAFVRTGNLLLLVIQANSLPKGFFFGRLSLKRIRFLA